MSINDIPPEILEIIFNYTGECKIVIGHVCYLWRTLVPTIDSDCTELARYSLDLMKWAYSVGYCWRPKAYVWAVKNNDLDTLIWLRGHNICPWNRKKLVSLAVKNRNKALMRFIMNGAGAKVYEVLAEAAIKNGMLTLLKKLVVEKRINLNILGFHIAKVIVSHNQIEIMKYLISQNVHIYTSLGQHITSIEMAKICIEHNNDIYSSELCIGAAKGNNLEMLKWLRKPTFNTSIENDKNRGISWHPRTIEYAAANNNREIISYLRSEVAPWGNALYSAAKHEHYDLIKYMRDHTIHEDVCSWSRDAISLIISKGNAEFIEWMIHDI